jgi:steroid delta-isomerase-like uncharacterized protein
LIAACGGESEVAPPPQAPPPPVATQAPPPPAAEPTPPPEPPKPSLAELEKQLSQTALAAINGHDAKKFAETFTPEGTLTIYGMGELKGREAIQGDMQKTFDAYPDFKIAVTKSYVKEDLVINEWVMNGTQKGDFMGVKATGKPVGVRGLSVLWISSDGLTKQEHRYFDGSTIMSQLGQMKGPARPIPSLPSGEPETHVAKGGDDEAKQIDLVKAMYAAMDKKSEADFLAPLDDKLAWSDLSAPKDMTGKPEAKKFFQMFTKAFTDMKTTADPIFAADGFVVAETTTSATHSGSLGPFKATKKPVVLHGVDIVTVKDGKILQGVSYVNGLELPAQEGLLPKPKADAAAKSDKSKDEKGKAGDAKEKGASGEKADKSKGETKPKAAETKGDKEKK